MDRFYHYADFFAPSTRLVLALVFAALTMMFVLHGSEAALFPLLGSVLLVWDVTRNSAVWIGFRAFRQGNVARVRRCLEEVRWPVLLSAGSRAYYEWLKGVVDAADGRYEAARVHLLVAATGALRTENDRSLVHCLLAEIALQQGDRVVAGEHLRIADALSHPPEVAQIIAKLRHRVLGQGD